MFLLLSNVTNKICKPYILKLNTNIEINIITDFMNNNFKLKRLIKQNVLQFHQTSFKSSMV